MAGGAKERYTELSFRRDSALKRARQFAEITIPSILPPEGWDGTQALPQPYSGLGSRCVINLASRIASAILPPGVSSFRFIVPPKVLLKSGNDTLPPDIERGLAISEQIVSEEIEQRGWRNATNTSLQHLIVAGNILEYLQQDNTIRSYRLDQYVVVRDPQGRPIEIVIEEALFPASVPEKARGLIGESASSKTAIPLYTHLTLDGSRWKAYQEMNDQIVPGSDGGYDGDKLPFFPLRWAEVLGEDYGRAKVEEHFADLVSVESLTKSILEGAAMASRNIVMLKPNATGGLNLRRRMTQAKNGEVVIGNPDDVDLKSFANVSGLQFVSGELATLKQDVGAAFLLNSAMRRDAERVTKYELSLDVRELEGTLGGVYSMLNEEMSTPRIRRLTYQMQRQEALPPWPEGMVSPVVLTGVEALGREQDVNRVTTAVETLKGMDQEAQDWANTPVLLNKLFLGLGIPGAVRSEDEVKAERQDRAARQAITAAGPNIAKGAMEAAPQ